MRYTRLWFGLYFSCRRWSLDNVTSKSFESCLLRELSSMAITKRDDDHNNEIARSVRRRIVQRKPRAGGGAVTTGKMSRGDFTVRKFTGRIRRSMIALDFYFVGRGSKINCRGGGIIAGPRLITTRWALLIESPRRYIISTRYKPTFYFVL